MNAVQTTPKITYCRAMDEGICLRCGAPAEYDERYGAPYCADCKRRHEVEMAKARKAHPGRFSW